ncbi:hypothetical protein LT493_44215 [Streptomyces tricolor]|nr:hypothetical protein [Streptomyces tricolor]
MDQPAAVAAVPWMSVEEQQQSGAVSTWRACSRSPRNSPVRVVSRHGTSSSAACSPVPLTPRSLLRRRADRIHPGLRRRTPPSTTAPRTGGTCCPRIDVPTLGIGCDGSHACTRGRSGTSPTGSPARAARLPGLGGQLALSFLENLPAFNDVVGTFLSSTQN